MKRHARHGFRGQNQPHSMLEAIMSLLRGGTIAIDKKFKEFRWLDRHAARHARRHAAATVWRS